MASKSKMAAASGTKLPRLTKKVMSDSTCSESSDHGFYSRMTNSSGSISSKLPLPRPRKAMTDSTCSEGSSDLGAVESFLESKRESDSQMQAMKAKMAAMEATEAKIAAMETSPKMAARKNAVPTLRSPKSTRRVLSDSAYSDSSDHSLSDLKDANVRLRSQLDGEKTRFRNMYRDKQLEVKQLHDKNHTKLAIALKELRVRLHQEKAKEIMQVSPILEYFILICRK